MGIICSGIDGKAGYKIGAYSTKINKIEKKVCGKIYIKCNL